MTDHELIHIIATTMRQLDRETAPHFSGTYESDAAAIVRALRKAGAIE